MIRVASEGYDHAMVPSGSFMWIGGLLHQLMRQAGVVDIWVPVPEWRGPYQVIDRNGFPVREVAGRTGGDEGGRGT